MHLLNLKKLECWYCEDITDESIQHLVHLTELYGWNCAGITNNSIQHLVNLTDVICPTITKKLI